MLKYTFKHLVAKYNFLGLKLDYKIREKVGYNIIDSKGKTLYIFKTRQQAEKKVDELIEEYKAKM